MTQETLLRQDEKKLLFSFSNPKDLKSPKIRFPLEHKVKQVQDKVWTIWQLEFSGSDCEEHATRFRTDVSKTLKVARRVVRCLLDILSLPERQSLVGARTLRNATLLSQIVSNALWENTSHVARQLRGIGSKYSSDLVSPSSLASRPSPLVPRLSTLLTLALPLASRCARVSPPLTPSARACPSSWMDSATGSRRSGKSCCARFARFPSTESPVDRCSRVRHRLASSSRLTS